MIKTKNQDLLKLLNKLIIGVEKDKNYMSKDIFFELSETEQLKHIRGVNIKITEIEELNREINELLEYAPDLSDKIFLSEVIELENPSFGSNNLILAPVGSGKTTLITSKLIENKAHTVIFLVSNNALKEQLAPNDNETRRKLANRMFTTQNDKVFGDKLYKIHLMTYAEFGERVYVNNNFISDIKQIFCDEIHSLPEFIKYGGKSNGGLIHSQRILFNKHPDKQIFYFTATDINLINMNEDRPGTLDCVTTFDYRLYPNIMRFIPRTMREITHIEQIRQYLKDRKRSFEFYNYKGMAYSKTISSLKKIEQIVIEEGYNPLVLWSKNNLDNPYTKTQKEARAELLKTNKIPDGYDFIIFNSAFQEGWNLKDSSVKLAIINTTNETEHIQALGRLRRDVDLLVYRTDKMDLKYEEYVPKEFINKPLTSMDKDMLCNHINIIGHSGKPVKWRKVKSILIDEGYNVEDIQKRIDGVNTRVSIITRPEA